MNISHIVAASENNVIGKNNELPWRLPKDFKYFKNKTWCMPIIMGRNTYESMKKELPGRRNIVITSRKDWHPENIEITNNINDAIKKAKESDTNEIFVIGGGEIFKQTMGIINKLYLTRVHTVIEDGDTFYPDIDKYKWKLTSSTSYPADEKNNYPFTFEVWEKNEKSSG
ncbi:MAG: dihydrofolate reductase [Ginsengibacter sp.]|jgi:dihydrofolate reductase